MTNELSFLLRAVHGSPERSTLTVRHLCTLCLLAEEPDPVKTRDIATALNVSRGVVTRITDQLSHFGYVRRRRGKDARDCFLGITEEGRGFVSSLLPPVTVGDVYREPRTEAA